MTSLREQFSAVRKAQFETQFDFFNSMTTQALDSASRVAALNLAVSRDAVQRSLDVGLSLMNSRDPRDVLCLGGQANEQVRSLFAYGRELLGIASGMRPYAVTPPQALALAQAPQLAIETVEVVERSVAQAAPAAEPVLAAPVEAPAAPEPAAVAAAEPAVVTAPEPAAVAVAAAEAVAEAVPAAEPAPGAEAVAEPAAESSAEPVVVASAVPLGVAEPEPAPEPLAVVAEPVPVVEPKAIAKAAGKGSARAAAAARPAAAPVSASAANEDADAPKLAAQQVSSRRKK